MHEEILDAIEAGNPVAAGGAVDRLFALHLRISRAVNVHPLGTPSSEPR
ncbi:hypothetical protein [Nonomuraea aridisoli]|nr:hypothetical protein [Nonomuraea aridisoli]